MIKNSVLSVINNKKIIREDLFVDSNDLALKSSVKAKKEKSDCVVRAFMIGLDISYDKAHAWVKTKLKRQDKKGTYTRKYINNILGKTKNHHKISLYGVTPKYRIGRFERSKILINKKYKKKTNYTVKSFMENHPEGIYIIIVRGHALCLKDGILYGNQCEQSQGFKRQIRYVLKISKINK